MRGYLDKNKRLLIRTMILLILSGALIYALYANLVVKDHNEKVQVGKAAPDFILPTINGDRFKLSDLEGKAVLINFWGSWCGPCKKEMPAIQSAYDQYKDQNFEVITINIQEAEITANNFMEQNNISLLVAMDKDGQVYDAYNVYNLPASFFLNPDGTVNRIYEGEMTRKNLDKWVNEIIPES